jgi:hypothetical protein
MPGTKRHEPADLLGMCAGIARYGPYCETQPAATTDLSPAVTPVNLFHDKPSLPSVP